MADFAYTTRDADTPQPRAGGSLIAETLGALTGLVALFVILALVLGGTEENLTGPVGHAISLSLTWLLGRWASFLVPVMMILFATRIFLGRSIEWRLSRFTGALLLLCAVTGLIALPTADDPELAEETFRRAGAIGTFMVEWEGLRLVGAFGLVGATIILGAMALVAAVLLTQRQVSELVAITWAFIQRQRGIETPEPAVDPASPALRTRENDGPIVPHLEDELPEPEPEPVRGLFGRLFGRSEPVLAEPDPAESTEIPLVEFPESYDQDALAASRALEEARIDEEYERALREEALRGSAPAPSPLFDSPAPLLARPTLDEDIVIHEPGLGDRPFLRGNPANNEMEVVDPADEDDLLRAPRLGDPRPEGPPPEVLAKGLAKLFPQRWEAQQGGETVRRNPNQKSEEEIRSAAEARAMRQASGVMARTVEVDPLEESLEGLDALEGEDDPLFDPELETRPAGVAGAIKANSVSALTAQEEDALTRRNRLLSGYRLPDVALLDDPPKVDNRMSREEILEISQALEKTFGDFNIEVKVMEVKQGPVVTRFEVRPAAGVKVSRIVSLEHDIAMALRADSVRIVAPIPGKAAVGIEVPNHNRAGVYVKELLSCNEFWDHASPLAFALGKTIEGQPYFADLKKMPHLLIAGATGAGKSVCLNTIICSLLYRMRPDRLRLLMVDPKRVELSIYQGIPHLISPVVCDAKRAAAALNWAVEQMEDRYKKLVEFSVRNIDGYNEIVSNPERHAKFRGRRMELMPHMIIIVDELADLMVVAKAEVEESIQRLAQMARAVGIHLILATQRPSVNVITGIIKANFPTRIAFQVSQKVDSRTILDSNGAEALLGRGDMLFAPAGAGKPIRVQGCFLSDEEVERIADHCRAMSEPMYEVEEFEPVLSEKEQRELAKLMGNPTDMDDMDRQGGLAAASRGTNKVMGKVNAGMFVPHDGGSAQAGDDEIDEALVRAAARVILEARKGSTSMVQRRLKVGFARAGRLMDMLEQMGIVGPYKGSKPRDLMVDCDAALAQLDVLENQLAANGTADSRRIAALLDKSADDEVIDEDDEEMDRP